MIFIYCSLLTLCYLLAAFSARRDLFSPRFIFNAYAWLKNVPYFFEVGNTYDESLQLRYFLYKLIAWLMVNIGISFYKKFLSRKYKYIYKDLSGSNGGLKKSYYIGIALFLVGSAMRVYVLSRAGGIGYVLSHLQVRRTLLSGLSYYSTISSIVLTCSVLVLEYYMCKTRTIGSKVVFIIALIMSCMFLLVFGARKPVLMLLLKVLMCYHYCKRTIRLRDLIKPRYIILGVIVIFLMVMIPMLRYSQNSNIYLAPALWIRTGANAVNSIFHEFSYLSGDMFVFDHFHYSEKWLGESYLNIFVQWIPSSIYHGKPPMDDGMYLYNMMQGFTVTPRMASNILPYQTSIPFTMEGALYSNFGLLGIILGSFFIGIFYQYIYKVTSDCGFSFYMLQIYQVIIFEYVPSVLHTTSPIISFVFVSIIMIPLFHIRIKKRLSRYIERESPTV